MLNKIFKKFAKYKKILYNKSIRLRLIGRFKTFLKGLDDLNV